MIASKWRTYSAFGDETSEMWRTYFRTSSVTSVAIEPQHVLALRTVRLRTVRTFKYGHEVQPRLNFAQELQPRLNFPRYGRNPNLPDLKSDGF